MFAHLTDEVKAWSVIQRKVERAHNFFFFSEKYVYTFTANGSLEKGDKISWAKVGNFDVSDLLLWKKYTMIKF